MTPAKLVYALVLSTALGLAVVYQSNARLQAGYRLQELRTDVGELQAERRLYQTQLSKLRNPKRIMRLVAWLGLDLQERRGAPAQAGPDELQTVQRRTGVDGESLANTPDVNGPPTGGPAGLPVADASGL